jgi:predicted membrane protein (TIGR00267 family)
MSWKNSRHLLLHIYRARGIARRYFITNGFDGALTMLGLLAGFYSRGTVPLPVAMSGCLGAAIALFMSGITSAYLSESAERKKELQELEQAVLTDLEDSDYGQASRYVPVMVALVNGLSPLLLSLVIISPLWLAQQSFPLNFPPILTAIIIALAVTFLLGIFLGRVGRTFWLWSGLRSLAVALLTLIIILFFNSGPK